MSAAAHAVFLSYASQDADAAGRVCAALRAAGIEVWFDQSELRGGEAWDASIRRQIQACTLFLAIVSRNTLARDEGYFRLEWKLAVDRSHRMSAGKAFVLPIVIDDTGSGGEHVPDKFREVQWTRLPGGTATPEFVARIQRLLAGEAPARAPERGDAGARPVRHGWAWLRNPATWLAATLFVSVIGFYASELLHPARERPAAESPPAAPGPRAAATAEPSIAVLPFADLSEKHDQEYFSDGLAAELLDRLAQTKGLKVIARTSSFSFKGSNADIPTIAARLRVDHVLEGSVRRAGDKIRVTTQLLRASTGEQVWSHSFDRNARDIFHVQENIADAVVSALRLKLAQGAAAPARGTQDPDAYFAYLRAGQQIGGHNPDDYRAAIETLNHAITLDPRFALAYARRANAQFNLSDETNDEAARKQAAADANRSIELDPTLAEGYIERAQIRAVGAWDWQGALADAQKALALDAGSSIVQQRYSMLLLIVGRPEDAVGHFQLATELDPLSSGAWGDLGLLRLALHDPEGARAAMRRATDVQPDDSFAWFNLGNAELLAGDAAKALADYRRITMAPLRATGVAMAEHSLGHPDESRRALDEAIATGADGLADQIADAFAWRHEADKAFEWLERAYRQHDGGLLEINIDRFKDPLRADRRFVKLRQQLGLAG